MDMTEQGADHLLDKTLRMNYLLDFYQSLLTEKQHQYMSLYYLDDLSLGEIAEEYEVSRQAVYDNIRRTEVMLEEYERKLGLLANSIRRRELLAELRVAMDENRGRATYDAIIDRIGRLDS